VTSTANATRTSRGSDSGGSRASTPPSLDARLQQWADTGLGDDREGEAHPDEDGGTPAALKGPTHPRPEPSTSPPDRTPCAGGPPMSRGDGGTFRTSDSWSRPATTGLRRDTWNEGLYGNRVEVVTCNKPRSLSSGL
jgi:hypothetical protein